MTQRKFPKYLHKHLKTTLGREPSHEEQSLLLRWTEFDKQRRFAQILTTEEGTSAPVTLAYLFRSKGSATLEDLGEGGIPAKTEYFTGAELAGLVRSAASFALARTVEKEADDGERSESHRA